MGHSRLVFHYNTCIQGATMKVFLTIINKNTCKELNIHDFVMMDAEQDPSVSKNFIILCSNAARDTLPSTAWCHII